MSIPTGKRRNRQPLRDYIPLKQGLRPTIDDRKTSSADDSETIFH